MHPLFAFTFFLIGFLVAFIPGIEPFVVKRKIARISLLLSLIVGVLVLVTVLVSIKNAVIKDAIIWGKELTFLFIGLLSTLLVRSEYKASTISNDLIKFKSEVLRLTLLTSIIICASFFFMVTIGKSRNAQAMEDFFVQSGYPASLNYVIMVVECIFSLGLLLHFKLKSGLVSVFVLLAVMLGAVITHVRNGDPIADSFDAFNQIFILLVIIFLLFTERRYEKQNF